MAFPSMPHGQEVAQVLAEASEEFLGMVKSYNARRGFGFIACEATAAKFGRDVYIAKAEAQLVFASDPGAAAAVADRQQPPSLAEEDLVRFRVRLSAEGFPQAEQIRAVRRLQGTLLVAPGDGAMGDAAADGRVVSDDLAAVHGGVREAIVPRAACGQTQLSAGDKVTFCVLDAGQADAAARRTQTPEALLVMRVPPKQSNLGCVLGCCTLILPRPPVSGTLQVGAVAGRPDLELHCHALGDRVILSGLPRDADQAELMRFFAKHGATAASVANSDLLSFAAIAFPGPAEVCRFIARSLHTFADDKETRLARLLPRRPAGADAARLPGLPAPTLAPAGDSGVLAVRWSPVVLAADYCVELRPAGVQGEWQAVDAATGQWARGGRSGAGCFGREVSSCRVTGLPTSVVFEARVTYHTACGCLSDASDPSDWCFARPGAAPQLNPARAAQQQQALAQAQAQAQAMFQAQASSHAAFGAAGGMTMPWAQAMPQCAADPWSAHGPPSWPGYGGGWCCPHGSTLTPPSTPELRIADELGFALLAQWTAVAHATAYVVELREAGSSHIERFARPMPVQAAPGSVIELRIGGLRPSAGGQVYTAQVRCVGPCGCESEPSPPATCAAPAVGMAQPPHFVGALANLQHSQLPVQAQHQMQPHQHQQHFQHMQQHMHQQAQQQAQQHVQQHMQQHMQQQMNPMQSMQMQHMMQQQAQAQAAAPYMQPPVASPMPAAPLDALAPAPSACAEHAFPASLASEVAKLAPWQEALQAAPRAHAGPAQDRLPSLLQSSRPPVGPECATAPQHPPQHAPQYAPPAAEPRKEEVPPEVTGCEDCILLD